MESASLSDALINLIPIYGPWITFGIVGNAVVFFRRFIAVLRMFAALLADANCMPWRQRNRRAVERFRYKDLLPEAQPTEFNSTTMHRCYPARHGIRA